jgi:serine/threonine protein kinase/Flp pilus assembly protein TadD
VTDDDDLRMSARVAALRPAADIVQREMFAQVYGALFDAPSEPVMLGRYMVVERRGAGGMGTVFAAWDTALQRRVALKVLHRAQARDRQDEILREARVLARVTDPHVVAIFDVGRDGDDSWIAMEYVDGVEIGRAARDGVGTARLAQWLAQAAAGIAAAHAGGVMHGDIKPSNILVAADGRARVVDFGMATVVGTQRIVGGTTGYLAPELADGGAPTTMADVFALCVTANELRAAQGLGPWPRRLARVIASGLDASPSRRPSIEVLAASLRAVAQRPRDRTKSAIVIGVGVAVIAASWQGSTRTECELALAPRWHTDLRARAETALLERGERGERTWSTIAPVLDERADAWTRARDTACTGDRALRSAIASCLDERDLAAVGVVESLASDELPRADQILAAAGDAADCIARPDSRPMYDDEVRQGLVRLQVAKALGDYPRALELAESLWALARRDDSHAATWRIAFELGDLRTLVGDRDTARELLASAYFGATAQGDDALALDAAILSMRLVSMGLGDLEGAESWRRNVLAILERIDPPRPLRVRATDALARLAQRRGEWIEARRLTESLLADPEAEHDDPELRVRLGLLYAGILRHDGDTEGQLAALERVVAIATSHHVPDHPDIGLSHIAYGSALDDAGRADEAIAALRIGIEILERVNMRDRLGDPHYLLGRALLAAGRLDEARVSFERSREIFAEVRGADHPDGVLPIIGLAEVEDARGDPTAARAHYERALVLAASRPGDRAHVVFAIGQLDLAAGAWDAALLRYREAREVFAEPGAWRVMLAETWVGEARALAGRGDVSQARAALGYARSLAEAEPRMPDFIVAIDDIDATLR